VKLSVPVSSITGVARKPLWVSPAIVASATAGSGLRSSIVCDPEPGIAKVIVSCPSAAFAFRIAWRSDPAPLSFVFVTANGLEGTSKHAENSDVFPSGSVTVAVSTSPGATGATASESKLVPLKSDPRWRAPSPLPDESQALLA
jgi:hypothetical protein